MRNLSSLICLSLLFGGFANAQINFSEASGGDLGEPSSPTDLGSVTVGLSSVMGTVTNSSGMDPDAFSFTVPAGLELTSLSFDALTGSRHFFAVSDGPLDTGGAGGTGNLVSTLVSSGDVGTNILDGSLNTFGGSGITNPLSAGSYNVWLQETNPNADVDYTISLEAVAVPEPGGLVFLGFAGFLGMLRRRW